jgi:GT2 family glycosyltransferase
MANKIRLVCATRATQEEFFAKTALGRSLKVYRSFKTFELRLYASNSTGLPLLYNHAIDAAATDPAILVFIHDDIYLSDFFWIDRIHAAAQSFDIAGVAGNKRRVPRQPTWAFVDENWTWDAADNLSGAVGCGRGFPSTGLDVYGPSKQECKLLDGLMLIADSTTLHRHELRFDPRFLFHFYDVDFCRQAELKGLRMGTWPISVIHESAGSSFGSPPWRQAYADYLAKYGEEGRS